MRFFPIIKYVDEIPIELTSTVKLSDLDQYYKDKEIIGFHGVYQTSTNIIYIWNGSGHKKSVLIHELAHWAAVILFNSHSPDCLAHRMIEKYLSFDRWPKFIQKLMKEEQG